MARSRTAVLAILGLGLFTAACRKDPPPLPAAPPPQAPATTSAPPAPSAPTVDPDAARRAEEARIREILSQRVYFDYDQSSIRADGRQLLDAKVPILRQNQGITLMIEGHADERGSTEYNIALGTRRAAAVVDYLMGMGLDARRFRSVSYGEERPLDPGRTDAAWSRNRRAEFLVGEAAVLPR